MMRYENSPLTVTYDITSVSYLAIRTPLQLASDEECRFPLGALTVRKHTYVDDVLAGGDNLEDTLQRRNRCSWLADSN